MKKRFTSLFINNTYIIISLIPVLLFSSGCRYIPGKSLNQGVLVGFCSDIVGLEEPVFTKPFLAALNKMEKQGQIHLQVQQNQFASEYRGALANLAQKNRIVFCGPLLSRVIVQAAQDFPDTFFVLMQAIPEDLPAVSEALPNLQWILYRKEDAVLLMGQICSFFPERAFCWLVTDLPDNHPIRVYEETAFAKGLQQSSYAQGVLEWPIIKNSPEEAYTDTLDRAAAVFCVTEGAYVPAFMEWVATLPEQCLYLIMPDDAWTSEANLPVLGTVLKEYTLPLEHILQQVISDSWQAGLHYMSVRNNGFFVNLTDSLWESSLKSEIESALNSSYDPEK